MYDQLMIDFEEFRVNREDYTPEERKRLLKYFEERKKKIDEERKKPLLI